MTPQRHRLPVSRQSITRKNAVGSLEFYVTVSFYDDEPLQPGEIFVNIAKEGSTLAGLVTSIALVISLALQHRSPWTEISKHLRGASFEPSGLGVDGETRYNSLSEAIAVTVDMVLEERERRHIEPFFEGSSKLMRCVSCKRMVLIDSGECPWCGYTQPSTSPPVPTLSESPFPTPTVSPSPSSEVGGSDQSASGSVPAPGTPGSPFCYPLLTVPASAQTRP